MCGKINFQALEREVASANLYAIRMQLLDVTGDFANLDRYDLPKPFAASFEERREKHLREALRPVATRWGRSVDELLRLVGTK